MIDLDLFAGPGGWSEAARTLGLAEFGIELDAAACATREAAGHKTIRADVSALDAAQFAGQVRGLIGSPPCTTFSAAGDGAGNAVTDLLARLVRNLFAGRDTREDCRRDMTATLTQSEWADDLEPEPRAAKIAKAVASASLVAEPARFIAACRPEWVALEQVPSVLPLWEVYAAELRAMGYSTWTGKLNAADYGVPQTRERAILIASRVREVRRPEPTHYDDRKAMQLWGTPWVSMAEALGWGAEARPGPSVTSGGTAAGGAEPFARGGREALEAEREAGRWALRRSRGEGMLDREGRGGRRDHPLEEPAPTITSAGSKVGANLSWVLHTNRDQRPDGTRQTVDPSTAPAPAPALTAKSGGQWVPRSGQSIAGEGRAERRADEPSVAIISRADLCSWVQTRPATTVQGDPRIGRPGHKDRDKGEAQFAVDSVRISVAEAAILQSFPADYPWQGTKTKQFEQVGNAVPPLLAAHVLSMATGIPFLAAEKAA